MFIPIKKFKKTNIQIYQANKLQTSQKGIVVSLKRDSNDQWTKGSKWLLKTNPFTWVVHEYVASKLYQLALGKKLVTDTALVTSHKSDVLRIAIKLHDNYKTNFILCDHEKNLHDIMGDSNTGFELAYTASRVFDEGDDNNLGNYAKKLSNHHFNITRYDFDDSLKFFHSTGITAGMTKEHLNKKTVAVLSQRGLDINAILDALNTVGLNLDFGWNLFFRNLGDEIWLRLIPKFQKSAKPFIKAFERLLHTDHDIRINSVKESFQEICKLVGNEMFDKHYNFHALLSQVNKLSQEIQELTGDTAFVKQYNTISLTNQMQVLHSAISQSNNKSNANTLADFTNLMISKNFVYLNNMLICLKVEHYIHENNIESFREFFRYNDYKQIKDIICESYYSYSLYDTAQGASTLTLEELVLDASSSEKTDYYDEAISSYMDLETYASEDPISYTLYDSANSDKNVYIIEGQVYILGMTNDEKELLQSDDVL